MVSMGLKTELASAAEVDATGISRLASNPNYAATSLNMNMNNGKGP
jgi:hypothetical protein